MKIQVKNNRAIIRLIILLSSLFCLPTMAQELVAKDWLVQMTAALHSQMFKASVIHQQANLTKPLIYLYSVVDNHEVAFIEYLEGSPKNIIRIDNTVTYIENGQPPYSITARRTEAITPFSSLNNLMNLGESYEFVLGSRSRVAGRQSQIIRLVPKDSFRYFLTLWIDVETKLPLRYAISDQDANVLEQTSVIELLVLKSAPPILKDILSKKWPTPVQYTREKGRNWSFSWLPVGFKILVHDKHRLLSTKDIVEYIALTDGLNNISVYVSNSTVSLPPGLETGSGLAFASKNLRDSQIVAVGKVPRQTLTRIIDNLQLNQ